MTDEEYFDRLRRYTLDELLEISHQIDHERFPRRVDRLHEEIEKRKSGVPPISDGRPARTEGLPDDWALDRFKAAAALLFSLFFVVAGIRQLLKPRLSVAETQFSQGEITHVRRDSTEQRRRKCWTGCTYFTYYVVFRVAGDPAYFSYHQSDPGYRKVKDAVLRKGTIQLRYINTGTWSMRPVEVVMAGDTLTTLADYNAGNRDEGQLMLLGGIFMGMVGWMMFALSFREHWHGWLRASPAGKT